MQGQDQQIKIIKPIGKGSYGEVFLCEDQLGHQIALKAIKRNLLDDKYYNSYKNELNALKKLQTASSKTSIHDEDNLEDDFQNINLQGQLSKRSMSFDQEMCFLKEQNSQLLCQDHEVNVKSNIIQFVKNIDSFSFQYENKSYSCHALFIEYAKNGCLGNFLDNPKFTALPISILRRIAKQLFQGIQEMHNAHLVHRDIKEDNIVFGEGFTLKLIDLSFAGRNDNEVCGTQKYISPEIKVKEVQFLNENSPQNNCLQIEQKSGGNKEQKFQKFAKIDTFAAGVVLFRIATKVYPFNSASQFDFKYKHIVSKQYDQFWQNVNFIINEPKAPSPDIQFNQFLHNHQIKEETLQDLDTSSNSLQSDSGIEDNLDYNENQSSSDQSNQENMHHSSSLNKNKNGIQQNRSSRKFLSYIKSKRAVSQINCFLTPNEQAFFQSLLSNEEIDDSDQIFSESAVLQSQKEQIEQLKDLIQNLLAYDVDERYGVQEALNHPFFTEYPTYYANSKDLQKFFDSLKS